MALIKKDGDHYVFKHGKHQGDTLEDVAESDPGYLKWMHENAVKDLDNEAFYALEDVMEKNDIEP
jgi:hypothetical protein